MGYTAFTPDITAAAFARDDSEASTVAGGFYANPALMRSRAVAGLEQLQAQPGVDPARIAAIGYCFDGQVSLNLAATGADISGVVSFHGGSVPVSAQEAAGIRAKILVLSRRPDRPDEAVSAFEQSLRVAPEVDWQVTPYSGAIHAFTLPEAAAPDHGAMYDPLADRRSWIAMRNFFDEIFAA